MRLAHPPGPHHPVPTEMAELADGPVTLVWQNEGGGLTGRVDGKSPRYIKWNPAGSSESLAAEATRLRWLAGRHPAPVVVDLVATDCCEMLVTEALHGRSAVDKRWARNPDAAVHAIGDGLRRLHSMSITSCPFDWSVGSRLDGARRLGHPIPAALTEFPAIDRLVICHGDPCAPNTLVGDDGCFIANVDLGRLGLADRWADLAVATMSFEWNYETFDEQVFWDSYGVERDEARVAYYRALWNAT